MIPMAIVMISTQYGLDIETALSGKQGYRPEGDRTACSYLQTFTYIYVYTCTLPRDVAF